MMITVKFSITIIIVMMLIKLVQYNYNDYLCQRSERALVFHQLQIALP